MTEFWAFGGENDVFAGFSGDVAREVFIGEEDDGVGTERFDNGVGVAGGTADVAFGFHVCVSVDVGDDRDAGKHGFELAHVFGGDAGGEGTARFLGGDEDGFGRVEDFGGFGHELHPTEDDDVGVGFGGDAAEVEGVAGEVGDGVVEGGFHVVVTEDDGVAFFFEAVDFVGEFGFVTEFNIRDDVGEFRLHG